MTNQARQKRVILFEQEELIHEQKDLTKLLQLTKQGLDLERISEEMEHLSINELILMSLHLCFVGKLKTFYLGWDV